MSLTCSSFAAPLQLGGSAGRVILGSIDLNDSSNMANSTNESQLWSWGKLPVGNFINATEKLAANQVNDDGLVAILPRSDTR